MKTLVISKQVKDAINEYSNLHLGDKEVCTPYYINEKRHKDLRAMVGKGTTEEIQMEARIWEKLKGLDFNNMSSKEIKQFLTDRGIGIDCSGFVIHVLNKWYESISGQAIWSALKVPTPSFRAWLGNKLRPVENIGAQTITNEDNAKKIKVKDVLPGDLIRSKAKRKDAHHIMIVTKVTYDDANNPTLIEYTHSSP